MKRLLLTFPVVVAILFLSACASGPKYKEYAASLPKPKKGESRVWFYRTAVVGAAVQPAVYLNGQKVGTAKPKGYFYTDRPAGTYEVKCTTEWTHKCQFSLAPDSEKFVKLNMGMGFFVGHVIPREESPIKALDEIQDLHLTTD